MATIPEITDITIKKDIRFKIPNISTINVQKNKTNGIRKIPTIWNVTINFAKIEYNKSIPLFYFGGV